MLHDGVEAWRNNERQGLSVPAFAGTTKAPYFIGSSSGT
jgi:hypothetical protein